MDATAVAAALGIAASGNVRQRDAIRLALLFGIAQGAFPVLGWTCGEFFASHIVGWGKWVTFGVLAALGAKMLHEAFEKAPEAAPSIQPKADVFSMKVLALLAVATSIDAFAAGVTLAIDHVPMLRASLVIGLVTGVLAFAGVHVGHRFGAHVGKRLVGVGGLVLLGLALKEVIPR
jgi:putative Mn2+ efflux pump MntP